MNRFLLGGLGALLLVGLGLFWWQGRAQVEEAAPPPEEIVASETVPVEPDIPLAEVGDLEGPVPPEATELTREERRFFRYDRNRDQSISRNEMLSTRTAAFRKLDKDGNNLLTFEEWAVATVTRFDTADADRDRSLSQQEFATTRPKRRVKKPSCRC